MTRPLGTKRPLIEHKCRSGTYAPPRGESLAKKPLLQECVCVCETQSVPLEHYPERRSEDAMRAG